MAYAAALTPFAVAGDDRLTFRARGLLAHLWGSSPERVPWPLLTPCDWQLSGEG